MLYRILFEDISTKLFLPKKDRLGERKIPASHQCYYVTCYITLRCMHKIQVCYHWKSESDFDLSRAFKVKCDGAIRLPICGFLSMFISNVLPNSAFRKAIHGLPVKPKL